MRLIDERAGELHDLAIERASGFTYDDVRKKFRWSYSQFMDAVRRVRRDFGEEDSTLICEPHGQRKRWIYRWASGLDEVKKWVRYRARDRVSRDNTTLSVAQSAVKADGDGRTTEGKIARKLVRTFSGGIEQLAWIDEELANGA